MGQTRVEGFAELERRLSTLTPAMQRNVLRGALRQAAKPIADAARAAAPTYSGPPRKDRAPGTLRAAIRVGSPRQGRDGVVSVSVGVKRTTAAQRLRGAADAFYARWVELGHLIVARRGKGLSSRTARRVAAAFAGKRVPPRPFLAPALEATAARAVQVLGDEVRRRLPEALK